MTNPDRGSAKNKIARCDSRNMYKLFVENRAAYVQNNNTKVSCYGFMMSRRGMIRRI